MSQSRTTLSLSLSLSLSRFSTKTAAHASQQAGVRLTRLQQQHSMYSIASWERVNIDTKVFGAPFLQLRIMVLYGSLLALSLSLSILLTNRVLLLQSTVPYSPSHEHTSIFFVHIRINVDGVWIKSFRMLLPRAAAAAEGTEERILLGPFHTAWLKS